MQPMSRTTRQLRAWRLRGRRQAGRALVLLLLSGALLLPILAAKASSETPKASVYQVQAAYLYNFGKFVRWPAVAPANQGGSFSICVFDQDPLAAVLQSTLAGESVGNRPVVIRRVAKAQEAGSCHILFISLAQRKELKEILAALDQKSVLTVSDIPDFSSEGGMIQFVFEGDRIRFEINLEGAQRAHLVFPSELLRVAVAVRKPARPGE